MTATRTEKRVKFDSSSSKIIHMLPNRSSPEGNVNTEDLWYSGAMYQENMKRLSATTNVDTSSFDSEDKDKEEDDCSCLTPERRLRRFHHTRSVLSMQAEILASNNDSSNAIAGQHRKHHQHVVVDKYDTRGLRALATALSKPDVQRARERATQCAREAFVVYDTTTPWMKATGMTVRDYANHSTSVGRGRGRGDVVNRQKGGIIRAGANNNRNNDTRTSTTSNNARPLSPEALTKESMLLRWAQREVEPLCF